MKKILSKSLALALALALLVAIIPFSNIRVSANQSTAYSGGYSNNYTLTGNGASDIVAVAKAQLGKTQSQLKYSEMWCDNFVSDCAILANQASAVPQGGAVSDFRNKLINAGATQVSSPIAGDIVILYCNNCKSWAHAGIMYNSTHFYDGNNWTDGYSHVHSTQCGYYMDECYNTSYISYYYYRPKYSSHTHSYTEYVYYWDSHPHYKCYKCSCGAIQENRNEPVYISTCEQCNPTPGKPVPKTDKENYDVGSNVTIKWDATSNAYYYWLVIKRNKVNIVNQSVNANTSYTLTNVEYGEYTVSLRAVSKNSVESEWSYCSFSVYDQNLIYEIVDNEVHITGCNTDATGDVEIPSSIKGYPVTSIGIGAFQDCTGLTSIIIPDSVASIGLQAFSGCSSLEEITLPFVGDKRHSANDTNQYPFGYIFGSRDYIGGKAIRQYYRGDNLSGETITDYCIPLALKNVTITNNTYIPYGAFYNCFTLRSIIISDSVQSIGDYVFSGCTGLASITISDSVTSIGDHAFSFCTSLTSITIPDSVTSIGSCAFDGCNSLTGVAIGDGVLNIGVCTFRDCASLKSITIPDSVTSIDVYAFDGCTGLTSVIIPNSVTSICSNAFYNCTSLTSIKIPDSVQNIDSYAFSSCDSLSSIDVGEGNSKYHSSGNCLIETETKKLISGCKSSVIPSDGSVEIIDYGAFTGCVGLTSITIPASVTKISNYALQMCSSIETIEVAKGNSKYHSSGNCLIETETKTLVVGCKNSIIPVDGSVTIIGDGAFSGCTGLTSITIPDGVTKIGLYVFNDCNLTSITIPKSVTFLYNPCGLYSDGKLKIYCYEGSRAEDFAKGMGIDYELLAEEHSHIVGNIWQTDSKSHWHVCTECGEAIDVAAHTYDNDKDTTCNECGYVRKIAVESETKITVDSKKAMTGNEFTVSVDLTKNPGMAYLKLEMDYDSDVFEFLSAKNLNVLSGTYTTSKTTDVKPYVLQWMGAENSTENGNIAELTFRVKEDAAVGDYTISINALEAYNEQYEDVEIDTHDGIITVSNVLAGDFNGDDVINGKDGILCSQILAGWDVEYEELAADLNGDGVFNGKDGILLSQYLAGWNVVLG